MVLFFFVVVVYLEARGVRANCIILAERQQQSLIVLSVGLSLGIKNTRPVTRLKVSLVVDIDLNLKSLSLNLDGVGGDTLGIEKSTNQHTETRGAPAHDLSSLEAELGSKDGI